MSKQPPPEPTASAVDPCPTAGLFRKGLTSIIATVKILKFGTPQTIAIIVLEIEKFDLTLH